MFAKSMMFFLFISIFNSGCSFLFFYPQKEFIDNLYLAQVSYEDVYFKSSDGLTLHGWHIKAKEKKLGTILHFHGNAQNISTHVNNVLWLAFEGYDIFTFDYRGYGRSEGRPSIDGVNRDALSALEFVLTHPDIKDGPLFIFGQSLGGAIAVYSAATSPYKRQVKAVIVDSAFSSYRVIAREKLADFVLTWPFQFPFSFFFNDDYSPVKWIKNVSPLPLLIIHSEQDTLVPPHHAKIIYEEADEPKEIWLVSGVGHIQAFSLKSVRERFLEYLRNIK